MYNLRGSLRYPFEDHHAAREARHAWHPGLVSACAREASRLRKGVFERRELPAIGPSSGCDIGLGAPVQRPAKYTYSPAALTVSRSYREARISCYPCFSCVTILVGEPSKPKKG